MSAPPQIPLTTFYKLNWVIEHRENIVGKLMLREGDQEEDQEGVVGLEVLQHEESRVKRVQVLCTWYCDRPIHSPRRS